MRIAIDVMGGDHAPDAILAGCFAAADLLSKDDRLVLVGDGDVVRGALEAKGLAGDGRFEVIPTTQIIEMDEQPVNALRGKPDSSIVKLAELGHPRAGDKRCEVIISAGNTGAFVAAAQMSLRRLEGVNRPGIAVTMPTFAGPIVLCDVGANPEPRSQHLYQYAQMASVYAHRVAGVENPRVALLSIGGEEGKGNALVRDAAKLIREDGSMNYVGYVEGRDLFAGKADVVITEGFTGNVVIKLCEGLAEALFRTIGREIAQANPELGAKFEPVVRSIYKKHDYHEFGGAPLLGANGVCMICHGSSEARTIAAAITNSIKYARLGVNEAIVETLGDLAAARGESP